MTETVTIPKDEYDLLLKCRHILKSEFEERYSAEFIEEVKKSEEEYKKGDHVRFTDKEAANQYLDSL